MNTLDLLKKTSVGSFYAHELEKGLQKGVHQYPFLKKIDKVLSICDSQKDIFSIKFANLNNRSQLLDKLSELIVGELYLDRDPVFSADAVREPDIYLKKEQEYIEVKRINNSDYQNEVVCNLAQNKTTYYSTRDVGMFKKKEGKVFRKAVEHVNKAMEQMSGKRGYIYI